MANPPSARWTTRATLSKPARPKSRARAPVGRSPRAAA